MKMKSFLITAVLATAIFGFGASANAQVDTQALIAQLQAQITQLLVQIQVLQAQQGVTPVVWCHTFDKNLRFGDSGNEVSALVKALVKEGVIDNSLNENIQGEDFNEQIASSIVEFQEKYASDILVPLKLKHGTGNFGPTTRKKMNALYGCNIACAQDAKQCSDGSYVSRTGPNCEFAQCPKIRCTTDSDCPQPNCINAATGATPNCVGSSFKCVEEKCVPSGASQVKESVKCVFNNNVKNAEQKCYTADEGQSRFSCSGTFSCVVDVYGKKGEKLDWKSSCGNHAYTTIDGENEYAQFDCSTTQPFITVLSPNGGETYKTGDSITVNWKTSGVSSSEMLSIIRLRAHPNGQEYNLTTNVLNDSQEVIPIPSSVPVGSYTLEIKTYVNNVLVFDSSDSYFKIVDITQPSITVLSPNGGETWTKGTTQTIKWQDNTVYPPCVVGSPCASQSPKYYDIKLVTYYPPCAGEVCPKYSYIAPYTIATGVSGSSSNWYVGKIVNYDGTGGTAPDGSYTVQICQTGTNTCDSSDSYFKIVAPTVGINVSDNLLASISDAIARIVQGIQGLLKK